MLQPLWKIDECSALFGRMHLRGWCHVPGQQIVSVDAVFADDDVTVPVCSFGVPSPDIASAIDPVATHSRFDEWVEIPRSVEGHDFHLRLRLGDGAEIVTGSAQQNAMAGDPYHACWTEFVARLNELPAGRVLEIGSRARSAITRRDAVPKHLEYVGLDIMSGPNVDRVGDAHELERVFGRDQFVAALSFSVFEHLAMPWKVAIELNRVLKPGGIVFTQTHQAWPVHEAPWDFWRFSEYSWQTLFNAATGFEVVRAACGEPGSIYAHRASAFARDLPMQRVFLGSASIVRKTGETTLSWPVPTEIAAAGAYPKGELTEPPR